MSDERTRGVPGHTTRRQLIGAAGGSLVLALTPFEIARGATLLAVRVWPAEDYSRLTLEHDTPLRFSHFMVRETSPLRLVVDIEDMDLTPKLKEIVGKVQPDDPYIALVRVGQNRILQADLFEHAKDIRAQLDAGAHLAEFGRLLEKADGKSFMGKRVSGDQAADAAAGNEKGGGAIRRGHRTRHGVTLITNARRPTIKPEMARRKACRA